MSDGEDDLASLRELRRANRRLQTELERSQHIAQEAQEQTRGVLRRFRTAWQQLETADAVRTAGAKLFVERLCSLVDFSARGEVTVSVDALHDACRQLCKTCAIEAPVTLMRAGAHSGMQAAHSRSPVAPSARQLQDEVDALQTGLVVLSLELTQAEAGAQTDARAAAEARHEHECTIQALELELEAKEFAAMAAEAALRELRRDFGTAIRTIAGVGDDQLQSAHGDGRSVRSPERSGARRAAGSALARAANPTAGVPRSALDNEFDSPSHLHNGPPYRSSLSRRGALFDEHPNGRRSASGGNNDDVDEEAAAELAQLDEDIGDLTARLRDLVASGWKR